MRARNIKPAFFTDAAVVDMSLEARLLFIGLWCAADREGRLEDHPRQLQIQIFPCDQVDVEARLNEIQAAGLIVRYQVQGARFVQVLNFLKHQNPHARELPSIIPPPALPEQSTTQVVPKHDLGDAQQEAGRVLARLIPDSGSLIPDSGFRIPEEKHLSAVPPDLPASPGTTAIFEHWKQAMGRNGATCFDDKRKKAVKWALKTYGTADCIAAIDGYAASDWHMGRDPTTGGKKNNDLTLIFRDAEHAEKFMHQPAKLSALEEIDRIWGGDDDNG